MKAKSKPFLLSRLSIQQRLPLLICSLLLVCIVIYGLANYFSLKKASLVIGKNRLTSLTTQLSSSFGQVAEMFIANSTAAAAKDPVIQYLKSNRNDYRTEALTEINKLKRDSTWVLVELLNKNLKPVLFADGPGVDINSSVNLAEVLAAAKLGADPTKITKLYQVKGGAYYPLISAVTDKQEVIGYIVSWKSFLTNAKAIAQFESFVGAEADFYVGNKDGSLWTNFIKPLPAAPFKVNAPGEIAYNSPDGQRMSVNIQPIAHTDMLLGIAFSEKTMLSGLGSFVNWIIVIGVVIMAIGIIAGWTMSRNITRPLDQLIKVANTISNGNYSTIVQIDRYQDDELGKLANAFNVMIEEVYRHHNELEDKVEERTLQLATVNKELEAFSYSVSHDLRAPLRAINGYSLMLKDDHEDDLDDEGRRLVKNIISNTKMMGQLIDDLLAFSRLGRKELVRTPVNMQLLTEAVVKELLQHEPEHKYQIAINELPFADGDEMMIKQVLINLIGNAIKYSSKRTDPQIEIGCREEDGKTIYFVRDNGAGFNMAYADKLFGVFQRLHSQQEFEGTGVGLALVKRIIDKHQGEIWAEGVENAGSVFYFSLPKT